MSGRTAFWLLAIAISLVACDYEQRASGIVLDKESHQPIAGVSIRKGHHGARVPEDKYLNYRSKQSGAFLVRYMTVSLFSGPALKVSFSKLDLEPLEITFDGRTQNDTVYPQR